jgi:hypothetical protein
MAVARHRSTRVPFANLEPVILHHAVLLKKAVRAKPVRV